MASPITRRLPMRLAAATAAGALAAGATALPAAAQTAEEPEVNFVFDGLIVPGGERSHGVIEVDLGPDYEGEAALTASLEIHTTEDGFEFDLADTTPTCEEVSGAVAIECTESPAGSYTFFDFEYWANDLAQPAVYDYTLTISLDDEPVKVIEGGIEIAGGFHPQPHRPFLHSDLEFSGVTPGTSVEVTPKFRQEHPMSGSAAAVVLSFGAPFSRIGIELEGAEVIAEYDNCVEGKWNSDRGVTCVITDFVDMPARILTLTDPITYAIDEHATGPLDICQCSYSVETINTHQLEENFGGVFWDESSSNLLGLETADSWAGAADPRVASYFGNITIITSANPYDLAIDDVNVEGQEGDEVTVTVPVVNNGPAAAYHRVDHWGTYEVRAQLPAGAELVRIDSEENDAWGCFHSDSLEHTFELAGENTFLDHFDLNCQFEGLKPGESIDFTFTVRILDAATAVDGLIEVSWTDSPDGTEALDGDLDNNWGVIGVNAAEEIAEAGDDTDASGKLPTTGTSMTIVISAAAAALVAGAVMFVLVRRRKANADW